MDDDRQAPSARPYGVPTYPDRREHGDRIEAELTRHGVWFCCVAVVAA